MSLQPVKRYPEQYLLAIVLVIVLAFLCGGTPSSILETQTTQVVITMWQWSTITSGGITTISVNSLPLCSGTRETLQAMSAFSILAIITCVFAISFIVLEMVGRGVHVHAAMISTVVLWFFSILPWSLGASLYVLPLCGVGLVPKDANYRFGGGFAALVVAWVLLTTAAPIYGVMRYYFRKRWERRALRRASSVRTVHVHQSGNVGGHSYVVTEDGFEAQDALGSTTVVTAPPKDSDTIRSSNSTHIPTPILNASESRTVFGDASPPARLEASRVNPATSGVFSTPVHATPQPAPPPRRVSLSMPSDVLY